jgi:hypothetical protein
MLPPPFSVAPTNRTARREIGWPYSFTQEPPDPTGMTSFCTLYLRILNFKGTKLSKSRGAFVEVPYFLSKYDPDALRFYLTATAPETRDTEPALRAPKGHPGRISSSGTTTN